MQATPRAANPFDLMLDPQAVLARMAHSERLALLQRRICRPLDRPLLGAAAAALQDDDEDLDLTADDEADDGDDAAVRA